MMIQNLLPKNEELRLKKMFENIDEDGDGTLDRDELLKGMTELYNEEVAIKEVKRIFDAADIDNSGRLDFTEFKCAFVKKELLIQEDKLMEMFKRYDKDDSGSISLDEFKATFENLAVDQERWEEMVKEIDKDGSGDINFDEFKSMMQHMISGHGM